MLDDVPMDHTDQAARARPTLFVLVADERSGKLLRRRANGALDEEWTTYSPDDRVRSLGQSPDTRELTAAPVTPASSRVANRTFVDELAARLSETSQREEIRSILLIAPHRFADAMRTGFGSALWGRVQHTVPRDATELDDAGLRKLVDATLEMYG